MDLSGRVALVTGAGRGIGRSIALALANEGAFVVVHYGESAGAAEAVVAEIESRGGGAFALGANLTRLTEIDRMFEDLDRGLLARRISGLDIVVNNAGISGFSDILRLTEDLYERVFQTNVKGLLFVTQRAVARMHDGGRVINLSSMVSHNAYPGSIAYAASKAAVDSITLSLAAGLGPRGITVNAVAPGATRTDFLAYLRDNPEREAELNRAAALGRIGEPGDVADVVAFLASDAARWITGERIRASGGMHL